MERERDLGEQPIAGLLTQLELDAHGLVAASTEQLTHKMVQRACNGRRLTPNVKGKVQRAMQTAAGREFKLADLFSY